MQRAWFTHKQNCQISKKKLARPLRQRQDELGKGEVFCNMDNYCLYSGGFYSFAEKGCPAKLGPIQGLK